MQFELDANEIRVLGSLVEKELTTPDYYPLSLSGLVAACNQKSNRDPVMQLAEGEVVEALDALMKRHLVSEKGGAGSRVPKYAHRLASTLFEERGLSRPELAVTCVLMLRGPQTIGELRTRTARMAEFADLDAVETTLLELATRADGPYVAELPRQPGQRERRFMHLLGGEPEAAVPFTAPPQAGPTEDRMAALEEEVAQLRDEVAALRAELEVLRGER